MLQRDRALRWKLLCKAAIAASAAVLAGCATVAPVEPADIRIAGERVFPESIASDAAGNLYIGSNGGTIYRTRTGARQAEPWIVPSAANGLRSLFGVFADEGRKVLWACSIPNLFAQPRQTGTSVLKAFDLATGELKASHEFPADKPSACNDIAVARDGTVYATETLSGPYYEEEFFEELWRVTGGKTDEKLARMMIAESKDMLNWIVFPVAGLCLVSLAALSLTGRRARSLA